MNTAANNSGNNGVTPLSKGVRFLAGSSVLIGSLFIILQCVTYWTLGEWVDWVSSGIWGGCCMIAAGSMTFQRRYNVHVMASLSILSGLATISIYSWNVSDLGTYGNSVYCKDNSTYYDSGFCDWRLASDIIFIILGCLAVLVNAALAAKSKEIGVPRSRFYTVGSPQVYQMNTYPANSTVVVNSGTGYPTYSYPTTTAVVYQNNNVPVYQPGTTAYYAPNTVQQLPPPPAYYPNQQQPQQQPYSPNQY